MSQFDPLNRCRMCGASSYRPVLDRDATGAMRATGLYRCSGCSVVFADLRAWREGGPDPQPPNVPARPSSAPSTTQAGVGQPERSPNFATYMQMPIGGAAGNHRAPSPAHDAPRDASADGDATR